MCVSVCVCDTCLDGYNKVVISFFFFYGAEAFFLSFSNAFLGRSNTSSGCDRDSE